MKRITDDEGLYWYKRNPQKMIRGVRGIGAAEIGCFNVVLDLIYADEDSCPDDATFIGAILGESARKTRALISKLIDLGKIILNSEGRLTNPRAEIELENRSEKSRIARESGQQGGLKRAAKAAAAKKNNTLPQAPLNQGKGEDKTGDLNNEVPSLFSPEVPMAPSAVVIVAIPLVDGSFFNVTDGLIAEFAAAYPAVDVTQQMVAMRVWSITNPTQRKTKRGVLAFINRWLSRAQDRGGGGMLAAGPPLPKRPNDGSPFSTGAVFDVIDGGKK